jgi:hypothetical protein
MSGHMKSFHEPMNVNMPRNAIAERPEGRATWKYWRKKPQPSIVEASMSSVRTEFWKNWRSQKIPKAPASEGTITDFSSPTQPSSVIMRNCGIVASCEGSRNVSMTRRNRTFFPRNENFAKANAASESMSSTKNVTVEATTTVLPIAAHTFTESITRVKFSAKRSPGSRGGGNSKIAAERWLDSTIIQ